MEAMPKDRSAAPPPAEYLPQHIGIIMDGNGRWAKARGLARECGHAGAARFLWILPATVKGSVCVI